jgi:hypothetical protein
MDFPERLKAVIKRSGLKREEFAEAAGKSRTQIFKYLGGEQNPTADFFQAVKRAFPWVNIEWLITGEGEMERPRTGGLHQVATGNGHIQVGGSVHGHLAGGRGRVSADQGVQVDADQLLNVLADYVSPKILEEIKARLNIR